MTGNSRHHPFQFRLRTLLLGTLAVSLVLGWFTARMRRAERQRVAVLEIARLGGTVLYDYERSSLGGGFSRWAEPSAPAWLRRLFGDDFFRSVVFVSFGHRPELTDDDLQCLRGLPQLQGLSIDQGQITDDGLRHLAGLTGLELLTLAQVEISDEGLEHLQGLKRLQSLNLFGTPVTGSGLAYLKSLPHLQKLNLAYTNLADDELASLRDCSRLEDVRFRGAHITDAALEYLADVAALKRVDFTATQVSEAGIEDFRMALPHVKVSR